MVLSLKQKVESVLEGMLSQPRFTCRISKSTSQLLPIMHFESLYHAQSGNHDR